MRYSMQRELIHDLVGVMGRRTSKGCPEGHGISALAIGGWTSIYKVLVSTTTVYPMQRVMGYGSTAMRYLPLQMGMSAWCSTQLHEGRGTHVIDMWLESIWFGVWLLHIWHLAIKWCGRGYLLVTRRQNPVVCLRRDYTLGSGPVPSLHDITYRWPSECVKFSQSRSL